MVIKFSSPLPNQHATSRANSKQEQYQVVVTHQKDGTNASPQQITRDPARRTTTGERPRNRWEDDVPRGYNEIGIPMTDVNNWVKERRPIVYPLYADGRRVRLK